MSAKAGSWPEWPPNLTGPDGPATYRAMMDVIKSPFYAEALEEAVNKSLLDGKELFLVEVYLEAKRRHEVARSRSE